MMTNKRIAEGIKGVIATLMDNVLDNVLEKNPFLVDVHHATKPLYAALVPDEIFKGSHFERRFVTPFGGVWEKLASVVSEEFHGQCQVGAKIEGLINRGRLKRIQEILNKLEHSSSQTKKLKPDWDSELKYILKGKGALVPCAVVCDLLVTNKKSGEKYAFELKAPLPNSDQTKVSKEKMLKLLAMEPSIVTKAFYALVYNPYGKKEDYAWSYPARWFDMRRDASVLIGEEFWDFIGGKGTYQVFIDEINSLGQEYKERIYREYLGIEPPDNNQMIL